MLCHRDLLKEKEVIVSEDNTWENKNGGIVDKSEMKK